MVTVLSEVALGLQSYMNTKRKTLHKRTRMQ